MAGEKDVNAKGKEGNGEGKDGATEVDIAALIQDRVTAHDQPMRKLAARLHDLAGHLAKLDAGCGGDKDDGADSLVDAAIASLDHFDADLANHRESLACNILAAECCVAEAKDAVDTARSLDESASGHLASSRSLQEELELARADLRRHGEYETLRGRIRSRPPRHETLARIAEAEAELAELEAESGSLSAQVGEKRKRYALLMHCVRDLSADGEWQG